MTVEQALRVTSIRSQNPRGFGGCIFSAKAIDDQGRVQDAAGYFVVKASASALGNSRVERGQWWKVAGEPLKRRLEVNGYQVTETQIEASSAFLLRPSGEHIITFIADNAAFEGIGYVKARKLWEAFGARLYDLLDGGDVDELSKVISKESAAQMVVAWLRHGDSRTLQWLQAKGFDLALGRKVLEFFGSTTVRLLEEDPYRLLSFSATWRQTDLLARSHFEVAVDDPRRLQGAVEEACYRVFSTGHTCVSEAKLMDYLEGVLGPQTKSLRWRGIISNALAQGLTNGSFVVGDSGVQPLGAMVMERQVAKAVATRLGAPKQSLLGVGDIEAVLRAYEQGEGVALNSEQRQAVYLGAAKSFVLVTGGAGVGKTTVLKALYAVYDRAEVSVTQVALAGRAAKRMQEATGRPAMTIANFLRTCKEGSLGERCAVVIDEASMVDIITMSQLCDMLGPKPRLVLVGDPAQLMPVGPGLVLHALEAEPQIATAQLTEVKRYGGDIAAAAAAIRLGEWPELDNDPDAPIAFVPCGGQSSGKGSIPEAVLSLYRKDPANTQILCARRRGPDGAVHLNELCQEMLSSEREPVRVWDTQYDDYAQVGLRLGDPVLCTRNLWERGLQNGSLGVVVEVESPPRVLTDEAGDECGVALAWVDWDDGVRRPIVEEMLDDLELGYAITVHKAQGSQWPRVIVPLTGHRLLDRTLVYTAVTRAQRQVLLVGDEAAARAAVKRIPRAQSRQVALGQWLARLLDDASESKQVTNL